MHLKAVRATLEARGDFDMANFPLMPKKWEKLEDVVIFKAPTNGAVGGFVIHYRGWNNSKSMQRN